MSLVGGNHSSAPKPQVRLRDVDPDFLRLVAEDEREQAGDVLLPALDVEQGRFDPRVLLTQAGGFCGVLISGMVTCQLQLADQVALRVLGPGAILPVLDDTSSAVIASSEWTAATALRLAVLGVQFIRAGARWPQLQRDILVRLGEQNEQIASQLALCQLPRVEDRLLAMLWLLAESWGKVTSAGTLLPLHFTHEALGAMVGARRPTVTLALGELAQAGAVVQRDGGWLLLESPPQPLRERRRVEPPELVELAPTDWAQEDEEQSPEHLRGQRRELIEHVSRLREQHRRALSLLQERLSRAEAIRNRAYEVRDRVREDRLTGRRDARLPR